MEIKFPVEIFVAGSVALLIWKLLGFLKVSYWIVSAPILFWVFIPYILVGLIFAIWFIYISIRFVFLSLVIAVLWTVLKVADIFEAMVDHFKPFSQRNRLRKLDKEALKALKKAGIK